MGRVKCHVGVVCRVGVMRVLRGCHLGVVWVLCGCHVGVVGIIWVLCGSCVGVICVPPPTLSGLDVFH